MCSICAGIYYRWIGFVISIYFSVRPIRTIIDIKTIEWVVSMALMKTCHGFMVSWLPSAGSPRLICWIGKWGVYYIQWRLDRKSHVEPMTRPVSFQQGSNKDLVITNLQKEKSIMFTSIVEYIWVCSTHRLEYIHFLVCVNRYGKSTAKDGSGVGRK